MSEDNSTLFSPMEIDAIGEILNISLGSSATAASTMLDRRVDITTPNVRVLNYQEFEFSSLEPAIVVEITYVSGLEGSNIMILKRNDIKTILEILMSTEYSDEEFQLDEIAISAVSELMNQMMGASATALSEFLGKSVNISTPRAFEIKNSDEFKEAYFDQTEPLVVVMFDLTIGENAASQFMSVLTIPLAKEIIKSFGLSEDGFEAPEDKGPYIEPQTEAAPVPDVPPAAPAPAPEAAPAPPPPPEYAPAPPAYGPAPPPYAPAPGYAPPPYAPGYAPPPGYYQDPKVINVEPQRTGYKANRAFVESEPANLDLIMTVPLQVSVEIGRTKKQVKEIMDFTKGSLVVLDKLAGDQVDIYVNGQRFAKGDVVVVDDSFGVKITEILDSVESVL